MAKLVWDQDGTREFEGGVSQVALFPMNDGAYGEGVAWSGVTGITENPSGADTTDLWADNIKYASLQSAEKFAFSIEALDYPDEWAECDGSKEVAPGVFMGQQARKAFGLVYRTEIGDDAHPGLDKGHKLNIIYNSTATPSGRSYTTINENPDAISMSWDANSTPAKVNFKIDGKEVRAVSKITIDSTKADSTKLKALEEKIYGGENQAPTMPTPDQVYDALKN